MRYTIYLDYREKKIKKLMFDGFENVISLPLPVGDIFVVVDGQGVLIERKSLTDFGNSIKDNRLWEQLRRMFVDGVLGIPVVRRLLLIHGPVELMSESSGLTWGQIIGALQDIQFNYNIPVFSVPDDNTFLEFIRILIKRENEGKNSGEIKELWSKAIPRKDMSDEEWKVYVLSSLPFVGEKLAKELIREFGTIEKVARANIAELKRVNGIGDKKARRIYKIFH
ncbi:MAG: ERCC4-type nuclease [Euryarchaeota archaeon]|nr:ERCC4-type nuclease [Euryarchaeota archaeon]